MKRTKSKFGRRCGLSAEPVPGRMIMEEKMRIAISTDGEHVSEHFGRCPQFTLIEVRDNRVVEQQVVDNPGHHPGFLPKFLNEKKVNTIVAGGMGQNAVNLFRAENIDTILGINGKIEDVIKDIIEGRLKGGESMCNPGRGKGYGIDKSVCEHE